MKQGSVEGKLVTLILVGRTRSADDQRSKRVVGKRNKRNDEAPSSERAKLLEVSVGVGTRQQDR